MERKTHAAAAKACYLKLSIALHPKPIKIRNFHIGVAAFERSKGDTDNFCWEAAANE
jgi:hypothetical protein